MSLLYGAGVWLLAAVSLGALVIGGVALARQLKTTPAGHGQPTENSWHGRNVILALSFLTGVPIFAAAIYFPLQNHLAYSAIPSKALIVDTVHEVSRKPIWDNSYFDRDEVVASVRGHYHAGETEAGQLGVVAFWRLASAHSTNWHVAKRRVGSNYELAVLEGESAAAGTWDFLVGGIELEKSYTGTISIVLILMKQDEITASARKFLDDELGWGFGQLPHEGRVAITAPTSFETRPVR